MSGMFTATAGMGPTSYANTLPADKGMTSQVSAKEQINRFYGRTEHEPKLSAYQNRAIIDQTLGDQYGDPKYTLDVGLTLKNLIRMDAETPWYTIIMPLQNTNKLVITGTTWKYNKRLPTPTPYHAPSPYISEETEKFYGKIKRYGEQLRMESDFFHTPEGQENFFLKLTGMAGDFVEGIRYDVMREMQAVIMDKKRYYFNQAYVEDPLKHIAIRVSMTGAMNKVPNNEEYNALGVILERLSRVLNDATGGGPYEMIVPMEWGIYMHKINMTPAAQPYYMYGDAGGQVFIQNGPTPKGTIGTNRFWEYDDIHVETGSKPLRMLERAVSVCEYYIAEFTGRDVDLFRKLTSMMGGHVDIKRSRNIWTYSATHDRYQEISVEDMIKNSHVVPSKHTKQAYRELKSKYSRLSGTDGLLTKFYPNGGLGKDESPNVMKHREAPHFLYYEDKYNTFHRTKYSGEADLNVTEAKDHRNQGQILCSILASKFNLDRIGSHYSNAFAIRMELQMARDSREYWAAFLEINILESIRVATAGANNITVGTFGPGAPSAQINATNTYRIFAGSLLSQQSDFDDFSERWGRRRTDAFPVLSTQPGGGYVIPAFRTEWRTDGLTAPPGCDCAVGILSIASMPTDNGWGKYYEAIRDHKNALLNMVECAQLIPEGEATNPLNRSPFVTDPDTGALDAFYTSCVSQFRAPLFLGGYNLRNAADNTDIVVSYPRPAVRTTGTSPYDGVTLSLGDGTSAATTGLGPNNFDTLEEAEYTTYDQAVDGDPTLLPSDFEYVRSVGPVTSTPLAAMTPYGLTATAYTNSGIGAATRMARGTRFFLKDVANPANAALALQEYIDQGITVQADGTTPINPLAADAAAQLTALLGAGQNIRFKNTTAAQASGYFPTGLVFTRGMLQSRTYSETNPICLPGDPAKHYYEPIPTTATATAVAHETAVKLLKTLGVTDIKGSRKAAGDWRTGISKHFGHFTWNQMHGRGMGLNGKGYLPNKREIVRNLQNMDSVDKYNDMKQRIRQARGEIASESRRSHEHGDEEMDEDVYYSEDGEGSGSGNIRSYGYGSGEEEDVYAGEEMEEEEGRGAPKTSVRRSSRRRRGGITALASAGTDDEPEEEVDEQILGRDTGFGSGGLLSSRRTRRRRRRSRRSRGTSGSSDFDAYAMAGAPLDPRSAAYYAGNGGPYTRGERGRRAPFATQTTKVSGQGGRHMFGAAEIDGTSGISTSTYSRTVTKARQGVDSAGVPVTSMREGYKMIYRFNGSNFVSKMTDLTTMPNDVCTAFTIAAMMGRQDEQEHWETMVTNGLHLPINFLLQRIIELYAESAILCKAGLGLTVVNNGDFKNAETVSTKTYHAHLTIHYGALVVQKDWLLMMEDARIVGYIGGKGDKFLTNRKQLLNGATHGKGNFRPSFICYAYPIACHSFYPILSLSGRWEFEDVRPENLPTDGALFPGVDWYELLWGWNSAIYRDRVGQRHWRKQGYIWPRTSHAGWYMAYDMNGASFSVKERGKGHLAGSDYSGALAALQGEVPFWKYPGDPAVF